MIDWAVFILLAGGAALCAIDGLLLHGQWLDERQYRYIGGSTRRWLVRKMRWRFATAVLLGALAVPYGWLIWNS